MTSLPLHSGHLLTKATFFCHQGGRYGEFQLYCESYLAWEQSPLIVPPYPAVLAAGVCINSTTNSVLLSTA